MNLFPILIYDHVVGWNDGQNIQTEAEWLYEKALQTGFSKHPGWEKNTHSLSDPTFEENILHKHRCYHLIDRINECVKEYTEQLQSVHNGWKITSSWLTSTAPGEYARMHDHGTSDISGVYYIKTHTDLAGNIYFINPNAVARATNLMVNSPSQHDMSPGVQCLYLFPGWLQHGTRINQWDQDRISLSFNVDFL